MTSFFWLTPTFISLCSILVWKQHLNEALASRLQLFKALQEAISLAPLFVPLQKREEALLSHTLWIYLQSNYPSATWYMPQWDAPRQRLWVSFLKNGKLQGACNQSGKKRWGSACGQTLVGTILALSLFALMALWFLHIYDSLHHHTEALWQAWSFH